MKSAVLDALQQARRDKIAVALVTDFSTGAQQLVFAEQAEDPVGLDSGALERVRDMLHHARSGEIEDTGLFVRSYVPDYRLLIIGAVHIAQALSGMARDCGYQVTVIDPRRAFATTSRFREEELCVEWPDEAMARLAPDAQTAVVTLAHDPKIDDPALAAALGSEAFYVGALGSIRTHAKRVERLTGLGLAGQLQRIHAPIGLDLGGRAHSEIAVAILAQVIQARYHRAV